MTWRSRPMKCQDLTFSALPNNRVSCDFLARGNIGLDFRLDNRSVAMRIPPGDCNKQPSESNRTQIDRTVAHEKIEKRRAVEKCDRDRSDGALPCSREQGDD